MGFGVWGLGFGVWDLRSVQGVGVKEVAWSLSVVPYLLKGSEVWFLAFFCGM